MSASEPSAEGDASGYKVPPKKTLEELKRMDEEDESLKRYKEALLGTATNAVPFPNNPKIVVLKSFSVCVENQPEKTISLIDLTSDESATDKCVGDPIPIPEGANYYIKVNFFVQRDIVTGLEYCQTAHRGPIKVDHSRTMLGCYAPQHDEREWKSDMCEAPKGAMHRGHYTIKSRFTDADKNDYVSWKWAIQVVKASS